MSGVGWVVVVSQIGLGRDTGLSTAGRCVITLRACVATHRTGGRGSSPPECQSCASSASVMERGVSVRLPLALTEGTHNMHKLPYAAKQCSCAASTAPLTWEKMSTRLPRDCSLGSSLSSSTILPVDKGREGDRC